MNASLRVRRVAASVGVAATLGLLSACGSGSSGAKIPSSPSGTASADFGTLHIRGAYIPNPASPDVAAAYLSVTNTGSTDDVLTGVSSPLAASVMAHDTLDTSGGSEEMVPLGRVAVPAHQTVAFTIGHRHLMLMNPQPLHQGEKVTMVFSFAHAGTLRMSVPVTAITGPQDGVVSGSPVPVDTAAMPGVSGMGG